MWEQGEHQIGALNRAADSKGGGEEKNRISRRIKRVPGEEEAAAWLWKEAGLQAGL